MPDTSAWLLSGSIGLTLFALVAGLGGLAFILRRLNVKPPSIMLAIIAGLLAAAVLYWIKQPIIAFAAIGAGFALSLGLVLLDIAQPKQP